MRHPRAGIRGPSPLLGAPMSRLFSIALVALLLGCRSQAEAPAPTAADSPRERSTWLFVGDSLTAGYGVAGDEIYTAHVEAAFRERGLPWTVRNAGVSGDTTAGVLRRIDWLLTPDVHTVFLVIGANDGLRGLPTEEARKNLGAIVDAARERGARVVLAGMKLPRNYGEEYGRAFEQIYRDVAGDRKLPLMPFFLEGVGGVDALNLPDGIHPNPEGHAIIARHVLAFLTAESLLEP